ncbi:hypothetical protein [Staphylococcus agnetis]|uniref:hypothetical protein n=1 Tax=Staphylococcus agnetis TaxID=985762 RepID=UPI000720192F|nr:hypothetical protein [Staphylococcus agnetis]ALN76765.1 hypothetical protein EP23_04905 [Staphylococcus agnetis]
MVKIKTKREMTLPELIQWGLENGEEHRNFRGSNDGEVCFHDGSWVSIEIAVEPDETFTVEIEEEITEETKIPVLIEVAKVNKSDDKNLHVYYYRGISIFEAKTNTIESKAFYMLNDDMTMTLIWKNGAMIE